MKIKVFHGLVNYGTQSGFFARELRNKGFDAISVVNPDRFKRLTDVELLHGGSFPVKLLRHTYNYLCKLYWLFKYNIFHFYAGSTLFPGQVDLPVIRLLGKKIIMEYLGTDIQGYEVSVQKYKWTNLRAIMTPEQGLIYDKRNHDRYKFEQKYIHKSLVCAPVYSEFVHGSEVLPLAIDIHKFQFSPLPEIKNNVFRIMHAPTHRANKGTDYILDALDRLKTEGFQIEVDLVENILHDSLLEQYKKCHLFIDQIMGGWYGTATIEAMAIGRPVIVCLREEYFQYIDYGKKIPAIHADPENIYDTIKATLESGFDKLLDIGLKSRAFVEEVHALSRVTEKLISIYNKL